MRVIVDGADLWSEADPAAALAENDISTKSLVIHDNVAIAIIDTAITDLSQFADYEPGTDQICIRTFITIRDSSCSLGTGDATIFDRDDCWDSIQLGPKSCSHWYKAAVGLKSQHT